METRVLRHVYLLYVAGDFFGLLRLSLCFSGVFGGIAEGRLCVSGLLISRNDGGIDSRDLLQSFFSCRLVVVDSPVKVCSTFVALRGFT